MVEFKAFNFCCRVSYVYLESYRILYVGVVSQADLKVHFMLYDFTARFRLVIN